MENSELVLYDQMRGAIAKCAAVDEVAGIKNRAAQLEAYARVRDDVEAQRQFAEIRLRACIKIGELSRDLEKATGNQYTVLHDTDDEKQKKTETLEQAGIKLRTAERYEELTGGREEQAQAVATSAAEVYLAEQQEKNEVPTMGGLKTAVRGALTKVFGERPIKEATKREPDLLVHFLYSPNWASTKGNFDPIALAQEVMEPFAQEEIDSCRAFIPLLEAFIEQTKQRFNIC